MPSLRHTSPTVSPLAKSRSASRKTRWICSAVRRLRMSPSLDQCSRRDYHITWTNFWGADQTQCSISSADSGEVGGFQAVRSHRHAVRVSDRREGGIVNSKEQIGFVLKGRRDGAEADHDAPETD